MELSSTCAFMLTMSWHNIKLASKLSIKQVHKRWSQIRYTFSNVHITFSLTVWNKQTKLFRNKQTNKTIFLLKWGANSCVVASFASALKPGSLVHVCWPGYALIDAGQLTCNLCYNIASQDPWKWLFKSERSPLYNL